MRWHTVATGFTALQGQAADHLVSKGYGPDIVLVLHPDKPGGTKIGTGPATDAGTLTDNHPAAGICFDHFDGPGPDNLIAHPDAKRQRIQPSGMGDTGTLNFSASSRIRTESGTMASSLSKAFFLCAVTRSEPVLTSRPGFTLRIQESITTACRSRPHLNPAKLAGTRRFRAG